MDDRNLYPGERRQGLFGLSLALLIAFFAGLVIMGALVRHSDRLVKLLRPPPPVSAPAPTLPGIAPPLQVLHPPPPAALPDSALAQRVRALEQHVAAIDAREAQTSGDASRAEGLLIAFAARRALDRGEPLGYLEGLLRQHFGGSDPQSVAMIIGASQRPVTLTALEDQLAGLHSALEGPAPHDGWWTEFRRQLGSLFVLRRADGPSPLPADRLARAMRALGAGQVDIALDEVAHLPAAAKAQDWMASARRYVLARTALDRIETAALLAPPSQPVPPVAPPPVQPAPAG